MIQKGIYRHFKGGIYEVIENAVHTETGDSLVLYRAVDRPSPIWARPEEMWNEMMWNGTANGKKRFELIEAEGTE